MLQVSGRSVLTVNPCQMHLIDLFRRRGHNVVAILADNCHNGEFLCFRISYGSSPEIIESFSFILLLQYSRRISV